MVGFGAHEHFYVGILPEASDYGSSSPNKTSSDSLHILWQELVI